MTSTIARRHAALSGDGENLPSRIAYTPEEKEGVHMQKRRLAIRQKSSNDWDGQAANDNIAWPLATALIREGNTELLKAAMMYRRVHDTAKSEAKLGGSSISLGEGVSLDRHTQIRNNGTIAHKHIRQSEAAGFDLPAKRRAKTDSDAPEKAEAGYTNVPKAWKGDEPVNNMIDAQAKLGALHSVLGPLVEPLEMAVIDGATYQAVGNFSNVADRSGSIAAGRAIVHMALVAVRDAFGEIKKSDLAG